jgi:DNA-binding NarL/FixJ family response regulator
MSASNGPDLGSALSAAKRAKIAVQAVSSSKGVKLLIGAPCTSRVDSVSTDRFATPEKIAGTAAAPKTRLTPREIQILKFIARGLHNHQIAARIHRSIKTVEKHRQSLHTKLSTHEVAGLTRQAVAMGLAECSRLALRRLERRAKLLTRRELEILKLVAQGSGNKWIASELHRSIKTVDHHRENIMKKLHLHRVAGLTSYAVSIGLV